MVSMDDAVLARMEKGGKRYEILVDPEMVDDFKNDPDSINIDDMCKRFGVKIWEIGDIVSRYKNKVNIINSK